MDELTKFGDIGAFVLVVVVFLRFMNEDSKRRDETHQKLVASIDRNTRSSDQLITFMTKLNGSLRKVVKEKKDNTNEL